MNIIKKSIIKSVIISSLLIILMPRTTLAAVGGDVRIDKSSATVTVGADGGPQTTRSPSSSHSSGGNGASWYQSLIEAARSIARSDVQKYVSSGMTSGDGWHGWTGWYNNISNIPGNSSGNSVENWINYTWNTTQGQETIRNITPLYWDWKFVNKDTGKTEYAMSGPLQRITRTFYDPGHYYVYYREYDRWETGYYKTVSGSTTVTVNGQSIEVPFSYTVWQSTGWHEGYLYGEDFKYLLDFELSTEQVGGGRGKTITVERGGKDVTQQQLETYTVQTVAR